MTTHNEKTGEEYAFIGGGSMGPIQLIYLAQIAKQRGTRLDNTTFHCYDPEGFGNGGIAYGKSHEQDKLNSVRTEMSPWDVMAFHKFCEEHLDETPSTTLTFNSRVQYREFLERQYEQAVKTIEELGGQVKEHKEYVAITRSTDEWNDNKNHFVITKADTKHPLLDITSDNLTLTVGYGPNNNFTDLMKWNGNGYTHSLYEEEAKAIPTDIEQTILVIGAGPALFDFANRFEEYADKTRLVIISREISDLDIRDVNAEVIDTNFLPSEMLDNAKNITTAAELKQAIQSEFNIAAEQGFTKRRAALDIIKTLPKIIPHLSEEERKQYVRSASYKALLHDATPVPQESHDTLSKYETYSITGRIQDNDIERTNNGKFKISISGQSIDKRIKAVHFEVDQIVNATGHGRTNAPILTSLKAQGLAHELPGLNVLETDESGYRLAGSGIACVGPAVHFGTDGIETFSVLAEKRAHEIIDQITARSQSLSQQQSSQMKKVI